MSRRYRQWRYKDRIAKLEPASYDEYERMQDADKRLFREFKGAELRRLGDQKLKEVNEDLAESSRKYEKVQSEQRERIFGAGPLIMTSNADAQLICGNCAFFAAAFDSNNAGDPQISTSKGECHKDPAAQDVSPFSVCSHHSALQGFAPSTDGRYAFAPAKRQEAPR